MQTSTIKLSEIMHGAWKEYSIASCEERGIPQFADGLKPVQRFLLCNGYKMAKTKFDKVAAIGSSVASLGYEHGEMSACNALVGLAAYHSNNIPLFEGDGNFGNVLEPDSAGAPRYIFARLSALVDYLYKDSELAPSSSDPEIVPPKYYLPIIPMCLVNGIKGIATGYAVDIPPHDPKSIINTLIKKCEGKSVRGSGVRPKYYGFTGEVSTSEEGTSYILTGKFSRRGTTHIIVTDLPPMFNTVTSYIKYLRKLVERGTIVSFEDNSCDDKYNFDITLRRGTSWDDSTVVEKLKLRSTHNWNLTTVMPNGKLHVWDKKTGISDMINEFYDFRIQYVEQRIQNNIRLLEIETKYLNGFIKFIEDINKKKIKINEMSDAELNSALCGVYGVPCEKTERICNAPMRTLTLEYTNKLRDKLTQTEEELKYYKNTTKEVEYKKDLQELLKRL